MTLLMPRQIEVSGPRGHRRPGRAATMAICLALFTWAVPVTHGSGGRDPWVLALGILSVVPALLLLRPWTVLPGWQVGVAVGPALATVLVCLTAPTGWDGLDELAAFAYAALLFLVVRAWADTPGRRSALAVVLALVGLEQFAQGWFAWWGGGSADELMIGTFYWHNQFAAFLLGTGTAAGLLAVRGVGGARVVGWLTAPWCLAGLLFASSRAALATFLVVWTGVVVLSFVQRRGRLPSVSLPAAGLGAATFLASPLLMTVSHGPFGALLAREADQGVGGNGRARLEFWSAAWRLGLDHPVTGAGFDSFAGAGSARLPLNAGLSAHVHNGYLQAFSDGGLVLAVAVALATLLPVAAALRGIRVSTRGGGPDEAVGIAVPAGLVALTLHSGVDFDWTYPSLLALFALVAALCPGRRGASKPPESGLAIRLWAALLVAVVVAAVPAAVRASALKRPDAQVPWWARPMAVAVPTEGPLRWLPAAGPCTAVLKDSHVRPARDLRAAVGCTERAAAEDPWLELLRAGAIVRLGEAERGLALAREATTSHADDHPLLLLGQAQVLAAAGDKQAALTVLRGLRDRLADASDLRRVEQVDAAIARLDAGSP